MGCGISNSAQSVAMQKVSYNFFIVTYILVKVSTSLDSTFTSKYKLIKYLFISLIMMLTNAHEFIAIIGSSEVAILVSYMKRWNVVLFPRLLLLKLWINVSI